MKPQHKATPVSQLLAAVPGIGPVGALSLALTVDPGRFTSGRPFAAWLGLTPKEHSTGGRQRLGGISRAGHERLRQLLGAVSAPRPGLSRLSELTGPLRDAGLEVAVVVAVRDLPAGVDQSAYRIVQEALTNTLRHAHATRASVTIREVGGALEVDVSDDGTGVADGSGPGRGLAGMRERAAMLGGTLDAGPRPDGGFRVRARLPLEPVR